MGAVTNFFGDLKMLYSAATTSPSGKATIGSIPLLVEGHAPRRPNDIALVHEDEYVTWQALNQRANRIVRRLADHGIRRGDAVSLFMQNRIEFVSTLLGICKPGDTVYSPLNTDFYDQIMRREVAF